MVGIIDGRLERGDGGRRGGEVGVTGAEVDHVHAPRDQVALLLRDGREQIDGSESKRFVKAWQKAEDRRKKAV
jgi:hypothetical protein